MSWEHVFGYFDWQETYREWVRTTPVNGQIVEVGVFLGRSLSFLAKEAIDQKRDELVIIGVDPFELEDWMRRDLAERLEPHGWDLKAAFEASMAEHAPRERSRVIIERLTSLQAAGRREGRTIDRVYIDGNHAEEAVRADISAWLPLVRPGGILGGHDFGNFGVEPAVRAAFGNDFQLRGSTWLHQVRA